MIVYDHGFNLNEWSIVIGLCVDSILMMILPKRFPRKTTVVFYMLGVFTGFFFDHSLSVEPVSFYDVNDNSSYQIMDFVSYFCYGPYSYMFFYFYDRIKPRSTPLYILVWSLLSTGIGMYYSYAGVFHFRHGYTFYYSFLIYLMVYSCWIFLYHRYSQVKE